jgi:hypothetical protein
VRDSQRECYTLVLFTIDILNIKCRYSPYLEFFIEEDHFSLENFAKTSSSSFLTEVRRYLKYALEEFNSSWKSDQTVVYLKIVQNS